MESNLDYFTDRETASRLILDTVTDPEKPVFLSFLVPTFRRVETLRSALDSIYHLTDLDSIAYEVIVVDNSADLSENNRTRAFLTSQAYKNLRYFINDENLGMEGNWNRGIWLARGNFVSMLHDDDLLAPCYLTAVCKALKGIRDRRLPGFMKVDYLIFEDENNLPELPESSTTLEKCTLFESLLTGLGPTWTPSCGMLFNREAVIAAGGFQRELNPSADHALGIRILQLGYSGYRTKHPFSYYRIGVNESMKFETIMGFIRQDDKIREALYSSTRLGPLFRFFFEKTIYSERIDFWIGYSKTNFGLDIPVSRLDFQGKYGRHPVFGFILAISRRIYRHIAFRIGG